MIIKKSLLKFSRYHYSKHRNTNKDEFLTFTALYCYCLCSKYSNYMQLLHDSCSNTYYHGFAVMFSELSSTSMEAESEDSELKIQLKSC